MNSSTTIDRLICSVFPGWGLQRVKARTNLNDINKLVGGGQGGYASAELNRLTKALRRSHISENALRPQGDILRAFSWELYRNNPAARKIVRQIQTKVVGTGMWPNSKATLPNGKPHVEFRRTARRIWAAVQCQLDAHGLPGRGGAHFADLCKMSISSNILGGNILYKFKPLTAAQQRQKKLLLPLQIQLIAPGRLDIGIEEHNGNDVFGGVEFDSADERVAYHILPYHPTDPRGRGVQKSQRVPAVGVGHLYVSEDVDQAIGTPWFAPAMDKSRDAEDYEYNELKAAAAGACVVAGYRRPTGASDFGAAPDSSWDLTDEDGNKINHLQPMMFLDLGTDGAIEGFNPQRPNTNAESFIQHLMRRIATAFPGVKGSSLTGDYRRSSFASERSADNEVWPEIEGLQQWFSCGFSQPVYEQVIDLAVFLGQFDGLSGFSLGDYTERRTEYLETEWQGPVARSINPTDDAEAASLRVRNGTSSPQIEAAKEGRSAFQILQDMKEYWEAIESQGFPPAIAEQMMLQTMGLGSAVDSDSSTKEEDDDSDDGNDEDDDDDDRSLINSRWSNATI